MQRFGLVLLGALALGLMGMGCVSTDWEARYLEKEMEARALQEQYDSLNQSLAEREATSDILQQELDKTRDELALLSAEMKQRVVEPEAPVVPVKVVPVANESSRIRQEADRLAREWGPGMVEVTQDGNIEITLNSDVTFAAGSYALTAEGKKILASVAEKLKGSFKGNQIRVLGHTDSDPIKKSPFKDNLELGAERASEVVRHLSNAHGIDPRRLIASSRGSTAPVADNKTTNGKKQNRRVEIVVVIPRTEILTAGN